MTAKLFMIDTLLRQEEIKHDSPVPKLGHCKLAAVDRPGEGATRTLRVQLSQIRASGVFLVGQHYYSRVAVIVTSDRERLRHDGLRSRRQQPLRLRRHHTRAQIQLMFLTITTVIHATAKSQRRRPVSDIHLCSLSKHD